MNFEMQKANLLADQIHGFIQFLEKKNSLIGNADRLYQVKLLTKEYRFQSIADELKRVNAHSHEEVYTYLLIGRFIKGLSVIDEYIRHHYDDLFILSARVHTMKNLCLTFLKMENLPAIH